MKMSGNNFIDIDSTYYIKKAAGKIVVSIFFLCVKTLYILFPSNKSIGTYYK